MGRKSGKRRKPSLPRIDLVEVDNPAWEPGHPDSIKKVAAVRALRDDPLGRLHARRQIGDAQFAAGREWQDTYEQTAIGAVHGIDTTREYVDSSPCRGIPVTDRTQRAVKQIGQWDRMLGSDGASIVRMVLVDGLSMDRIGKRFGDTSNRAVEYYGRRFRECLTRLAIEMGYRTEA